VNKSILATLMVFIFCVSLISGCATLTPWMFKGKVALKEYNGEFKQTLVQGKQYLESNYSIDFYVDIYKEDSDKRDIVRNSWFFGIWGKPGMDLNDIHMANEAWMRDFNRVADAWGLPHLENTQDNALFLMFHEFRHILQLKDKADDFRNDR